MLHLCPNFVCSADVPKRPRKGAPTFESFFSGVESIAAKRYLRTNIEQFASLARAKGEADVKRRLRVKKAQRKEESSSTNAVLLPYGAKPKPEIFLAEKTSNIAGADGEQISTEMETEKGFFVREDSYRDEYVVGTTAEFPEEEMTEPPIAYFGNVEEAAEHIEFQFPGQKFKNKKLSTVFAGDAQKQSMEVEEIGDWMSNYGTVAQKEEHICKMTLADAKCAGCGANFHCVNPSLPGFVPFEIYREVERNAKRLSMHQRTDHVCRRCYLLKEHNFLLNLNVSPVDYVSMMGHLKLVHEALILLIVDMTDLEASINRELPKIIGTNKPMIVIGNKIDLLPPGHRKGYLRHFLACLKAAVHSAGYTAQFNILKFLLLSAKTGFGVEDLITNIYQKWISPRGAIRSDIYMVGATNAGKSTLFNTFLQSDLCKVRAMDLVERVTTSIWPGTTLSLLKFPIMSPSSHQLEVRRRRLLAMQNWAKKESLMRKSAFGVTKHPKYVVLQGIIGSSFKEWEEEKQPVSVDKTIKYFEGELDNIEDIEQIEGTVTKKLGMNLNDYNFQRGNWCFDTPGTVNNDQVLDLFTLDELINVVPRAIIIPRVFSLQLNHSLLIGGVARLDLLEIGTIKAQMPTVYVTVFASNRLKKNVTATTLVDKYLHTFNGDSSLGAPIGGPKRLDKFPKLEAREFDVSNVTGLDEEVGFADVVFSSIGWMLITSRAESVKIRAWTPAAKGLMVRQPPLLPCAANYRGQRVPGTASYRTRPLRDSETFSGTQRSVRPKQIVGENSSTPFALGEPVEYVNFDFD
uniref:G domain-containing protein n=1 Tax=Globodera rostochiensis TaxID=31243 RepID=A0A914H312_GLORO